MTIFISFKLILLVFLVADKHKRVHMCVYFSFSLCKSEHTICMLFGKLLFHLIFLELTVLSLLKDIADSFYSCIALLCVNIL